MSIELHPVTKDRWGDLVKLFEGRGPRGGTPATDWCYCMWWRDRTEDKATNKRTMGRLVRGGAEPGLLAYDDDDPIGWVSIQPRPSHARLLASRSLGPRDDPGDAGIWSIVCLYVYPSARRSGLTERLIEGAVAHARRRGARVVEAYPLEKVTGADGRDYMGARKHFTAAKFRTHRDANGRVVMRRALRSRR